MLLDVGEGRVNKMWTIYIEEMEAKWCSANSSEITARKHRSCHHVAMVMDSHYLSPYGAQI